MAYFSGQASSYQELQNVLVSACVAQGWIWADGILNKGNAYVRLYVSSTLTNAQGPGLCIQGGTGKNGATLISPSVAEPRVGALSPTSPNLPAPSFPVKYQIFIFEDPSEVYLIIEYDIQRFMFLSFGVSNLTNKLWLSATSSKMFQQFSEYAQYTGFCIFATGSYPSGNSTWQTQFCSGFFCQIRSEQGATQSNSAILTEDGWSSSGDSRSTATNSCNAITTTNPLISRIPSKWSDAAVLLPIQILTNQPSNKTSIVAEIQNARYLRIDNYEPNQIITLGLDKWKILPFHKKNLVARDGGNSLDHSGTFGWAIRYEGP